MFVLFFFAAFVVLCSSKDRKQTGFGKIAVAWSIAVVWKIAEFRKKAGAGDQTTALIITNDCMLRCIKELLSLLFDLFGLR